MIPARDVAARAIGALLHRQPLTNAKVRFAWESSVGSAMARATSAALDSSGEVRVTADSEHWRREVVRSAPVIRRRLADLLGPDRARRITVTTKRHTS